jgi:putative aldouronate transport system substrate-binding protein
MKKAVRSLAVITALMFILASCQTSNGTTSSGTTGGSAASPAQSQAGSQSAADAASIPNFNPTGYPIVPEKVTLRVLFSANPNMPADPNDLWVIQRAEEITNVHIDYVSVPTNGFTEKKNLMLATGDLPDIVESQIPSSDLTRYGTDGTFIPMQDLIKKYGVNFTSLYQEYPDLEGFITAPDGNIYGLVQINDGPWMPTNGMGVINASWLKALGLDMPTDIHEFQEVLRAFKTQDPNGNGAADEVPFSFESSNPTSTFRSSWGIGYILSSFGIAISGSDEAYATVVDGQVVCQGTMPEFKEAISYFHSLYSEGLMDIEGFTMDNTAYRAKWNSDPGVVGYGQLWDLKGTVANPDLNQHYTYMPLLKGPDGRKAVFYKVPYSGIARGYGVITKACQTPEVAMRWLDYFYETDTSMEHLEGPIGVRLIEQPDGTLHLRQPPEGLSTTQDRWAHCNAGVLAVPASVYRDRLKLPATDDKVNFMLSFIEEYKDPTPMLPVFYTTEESAEMSQLQTDIRNYIDRRFSTWVMDGGVDQEWDAYLAEIDNVGLSKWLEIKQAAYDRFEASL